jgi:hypothetical protein
MKHGVRATGYYRCLPIAESYFSNPERSKFRRSIFQSSSIQLGKEIVHGVILMVISTNICGSDQLMVRGRTTAPAGMGLGHEIPGEVIEGIVKLSTNWRKDPP